MQFFVVNLAMAAVLILCAHSPVANGHGRMIDPPSRASMWRYGFENPPNYDDTAMYCGGYQVQWELNGGRCGVCGDRYDGPREHEAGGKYANGIIVRHYREGETINVSIDVTQSHLGYFEFRLCPNNNPSRAVTQQCLDRYLLKQPDGSTRFYIRSWSQGVRTVRLVLPPGLTCSQCMLQWKYNTGNSERCEGQGASRRCCLGCGDQEQFYACADVEIASAASGGVRPGQVQTANPGGHASVVVPSQYRVPATQYANLNPQYVPPSAQYVQPSAQYVPPSAQYVPPSAQYVQPSAQYVPGSQGLAALSPYYTQCHGLFQALTEECRRTCSTGTCSTVYCSQECHWLGAYFDEVENDESEKITDDCAEEPTQSSFDSGDLPQEK